jgi:carboxyl-terminal processing protease
MIKKFLHITAKTWQTLSAVVLIFALGFGAGALTFSRGNNASVAAGGVDLSVFWEVWNQLDRKYDGTLTQTQKLDAAINGLASGIGDSYTAYLPPDTTQDFVADIKGEFGGIGAELEMLSNQVTVVSPLAGTPAERAGIVTGDVITHVNSEATTGKSLDAVVKTIRGEAGTTVTLTVQKATEIKPIDLTITRAVIKIESVKSERLAGGTVQYMRLTQFREGAADQLRTVLDKANEDGITEVILDLRNNPGGLVDEAQAVAGLFIPRTVESDDSFLRNRVVVREKSASGEEISTLRATGSPAYPNGKLIVLLNNGSASASEIVAGALRDYGRATLLGEQSFGKGSVQELVPLSNGGTLKVTIARWFTPKGTGIDKDGITPDTEVAQALTESLTTSDLQVTAALQALGRK